MEFKIDHKDQILAKMVNSVWPESKDGWIVTVVPVNGAKRPKTDAQRNAFHVWLGLLAEELNALKLYIDFEQMRFKERFRYELNVDENVNTNAISVQPMTLKPFVENAIWHGLMLIERKGVLKVNVSKEGNYAKIVIEDNGIGRRKASEIHKDDTVSKKSFGLRITRERMALMRLSSNRNINFDIIDLYDDNQEPAGTKVEITYEI